MTRMYIQPSFIDSCSSHGEWSGNNGQYRGDKSAEISTFINGKANVKGFSDEAIERNKAKAKSKSVTDSILLAERNMNRLEDMSSQLEQEYMSKAIDTETYVYARKTLDARLEKAWLRIEKERVKLGLNNFSDVLTEEHCSSTLNTSKQNVVLHRVFDGVSHENSVLHVLMLVHSFYTKLKRIYRVIKNDH